MRPLAIPLLAIAALTAAAGCGSTSRAPGATASDVVVLRSGDGRLLAVDPAGGGPARTLAAAAAGRGWRRVYVATTLPGGATRVAAVDPATGRTIRARRLPGRWALPSTVTAGPPDALSPDGSTLVLRRTGGDGSAFALLDAGLDRPPRTVTLPGAFAYDALGPRGLLFLIEPRPADGPGHYRVRAYDLARGQLRAGAIVDKRELDEPSMTGEPTARTTTPDGDWVFTLYRNARKGPFVHALGAQDGIAFCIDLPRAARSNDAAARAWGLALSPGAGTLYAANPVLGLVVEIGTDSNAVRRVARIPRSPAQPVATAPLVSPQGEALYVPSGRGIEVVDTTTLAPGRRLLAGTAVRGLAAPAGGRRLYAATAAGELVGLDPRTGHVMARTRAPGAPVGVITR